MTPATRVAIVHDYLSQRGGAERVVLAIAKAYPEATIYTSLYEADKTFAEFAEHRILTSAFNAIGPLRRHHRLGLALYPIYFGALHIDADVVIVSSSAFAHGIRSSGKLLFYCHNPARFLYQVDDYQRGRSSFLRRATKLALWPYRASVRRSARRADYLLCNAGIVAERIAEFWGLEAEVLAPAPAITAEGEQEHVAGVAQGGAIIVARLMVHKRVDLALAALKLAGVQAVVVGDGPERATLEAAYPEAVFLGSVKDAQLRWLYNNADFHLTASHEDFGLTPLEAAAFGTPTIAPRQGGFLDTIIEGRTGLFFDELSAQAIATSIGELGAAGLAPDDLRAQAQAFSEARFTARIAQLVEQLAADQRPEG